MPEIKKNSWNEKQYKSCGGTKPSTVVKFLGTYDCKYQNSIKRWYQV